jgi:hypothetical protein
MIILTRSCREVSISWAIRFVLPSAGESAGISSTAFSISANMCGKVEFILKNVDSGYLRVKGKVWGGWTCERCPSKKT